MFLFLFPGIGQSPSNLQVGDFMDEFDFLKLKYF